MEMQLKAHQMAALQMDPHHQMAAMQMAAQDSQKEATNKLHQLADAHAAASRTSSGKTNDHRPLMEAPRGDPGLGLLMEPSGDE